MSALDELATRCGIQASTENVSGESRETSPELKLALLQAMRLNVTNEQEAAAVLDDLEATDWETALPPVLVAYGDAGCPWVPVTLPHQTEALRWKLLLEDGSELSGAANFGELPLLQERDHVGRRLQRRQLSLPHGLPWGYHKLKLSQTDGETVLVVTPGKCWLPELGQEERIWGLAANLFSLRSERNWGIGDFSDLRELAMLAKGTGADLVGLNPLHAMFSDKPEDASPYSPSDRTLLNVSYIDVEAVPELRHAGEARQLMAGAEFQLQLASARNASLVQYTTIANLKLPVLRLLFQTFEERRDPERLRAFEAFHEERRSDLDRACLFQAMRGFFASQDPPLSDCTEWPEQYRSSLSPAVLDFAREHVDLVRFQLWLQWVADTQLKCAAEAAKGMAVGFYRDLAVGAHPGGAEIWSHPEELVSAAQVGAPPDSLSPSGQNWGLPPLNPVEARKHAYSSFIGLLRANMRDAGGLRIDHAMALQRLYWIPKGNDASEGAYVQYPIHDLVGILALESQRHRCLVVGEDLGTVPEGFTDYMQAANILSYRVLFFEREDSSFILPGRYPRLGLSVASNHDLATLAGWWEGLDIGLRDRFGLIPGRAEAMREERALDREILVNRLYAEGLLARQTAVSREDFCEAAHGFLARTNCLLTLVELDDISGELEQVNVPATTSEHPNWRRRLSLTLEELRSDPRFTRLANMMIEERKGVSVSK